MIAAERRNRHKNTENTKGIEKNCVFVAIPPFLQRIHFGIETIAVNYITSYTRYNRGYKKRIMKGLVIGICKRPTNFPK
ncbi:MAG: hypothetical protein R2911_41775 [Caldilineaceae bacterium]